MRGEAFSAQGFEPCFHALKGFHNFVYGLFGLSIASSDMVGFQLLGLWLAQEIK